MSLLSFQNFTAPFRQKFHLITIVMVVAVFAVLRLSGAEFEVQRKSGPLSPNFAVDTLPSSPFGQSQVNRNAGLPGVGDDSRRMPSALPGPNSRTGTFSLRQENQRGLIDEVMRPDPVVAARRQAAEEQQRELDRKVRDGDGSLSDIEKRLGLK